MAVEDWLSDSRHRDDLRRDMSALPCSLRSRACALDCGESAGLPMRILVIDNDRDRLESLSMGCSGGPEEARIPGYQPARRRGRGADGPNRRRGSAAVIPALPVLLVFGRDVDEVLGRVRAAVAFHVGRGPLSVRLAVSRHDRGELLADLPSLSGGQRDLHTRALVGDRPGSS